jgi:hypothetical protein
VRYYNAFQAISLGTTSGLVGQPGDNFGPVEERLVYYAMKMRYEEVKQFLRSWVEVYMDADYEPSYRGVFLSGDCVSFAVNGKESDGAVPTTPRQRPPISRIGKIVPLGDPPWLIASNKGATVAAARGIVRRSRSDPEE